MSDRLLVSFILNSIKRKLAIPCQRKVQVSFETSCSSVWSPFTCPKKKGSNGSQLSVWELNLLLLVHNLSWANGQITKQNALRRFFPFLLLKLMAYKSPQASLCQVVTWTKAPSNSWCALRFACQDTVNPNVETGTSASSPNVSNMGI